VEEKMIKISEAEYEGMKETIEILQNPDMITQILESEKNIREGDIEELD
jgi:PHD/YefM family antitoxin component YafN of YafNO toxin-antitoxin module